MNKATSLLIAALCQLTFVASVSAHVTLVYPTGGETFVPGSEVKIEWRLVISHGDQDWDLYFSSDGGLHWEAIQLDMPVAVLSYQWTVPDIETTQGRIKVVQDNAGLDYTDGCENFTIQATATAVTGSTPLPDSPVLFASYPNPFTASTSFDFLLPQAGNVQLEVFDLLGVKVATLVAAPLASGRHHVTWQPRGLAPGVYLYRLEVEGRAQVGRVVRVE